MNVHRTAFRRARTGSGLATGLIAATALVVSGCSSSSGSSSAVPGAPGAKGGSAAASASKTVDALIAAEQPADASLLPSGSTAAKIKAKGTLVVGGTQTAALFSLLDPTTGKVDGFDAAMSELLAKYIIGKPSTKLVNVTSATREALLKSHQVDTVFATYTITPEREKSVAFAGPYYQDGLAIEVKKSTSGIESAADLAGKTVVTESGSTAAAAVKKAAPTAKVQLFDTNTECLQALQQGRADAYVLDQGILAGNASTNSDVKVSSSTFSQEPYGIGLPLDQPDFKVFVNNWLKKVEADGTWAKVWKATVGTQVPGDAPTPPTVS
ncbi:glutamate ABC transporter substrate-binding protein [Actinacidiphila sp. bgisy144]|uniref:glutamate ABC transporter substrate-binding protein n=1 Tax=Actinacidiphila sp. bgisy144 TaxID=3413791 RepID=UPI003EBFAFAD